MNTQLIQPLKPARVIATPQRLVAIRSSGRKAMAFIVVLGALALSIRSAHAEEAAAPAEPAKVTAPSLSDVLTASGLAITGYLDVSYQHLNGEGYFAYNSGADRVFDARKDGFALQQAALTVAYQPNEGFGAVVNLTAGQDADVIAPFDSNPGAHSKFDVTQAYVQYVGGPLTIIGGKYVTLAGAEVINPTADTNFSRSILFGYAIPFTHTGVRATIAANDQLSFIVGVNNGWDDLKDTNTAKTVELGVSYAPIKTLTFAAQGYFGKEHVGGFTTDPTDPEGTRSLVDVVATWNVTDAFTVVVNYDWGKQANALGNGNSAKWDGLAAYFNFQIDEKCRVSLRGEYLNDKDAYRTGAVQKWKELTATFAYAPVKPVELRFEVRYDKSDIDAFAKSVDVSDGITINSSDNQSSIALEALYKF